MNPTPSRWGSRARILAVVGLSLLVAAIPLAAGPAPLGQPAETGRIGLPSRSEAQLIVEAFRKQRLPGPSPSYLEFEIRELPRRGRERVMRGRLWSGPNEQGPAARIALGEPGSETRFLVQGGTNPRAWRWTAGASTEVRDLLAPLLPGDNITPFDLEMPFLSWPDPRVLSINHVLGRAANGFRFEPPPDFRIAHPAIIGVRAYLDYVYNAPLSIQLIGQNDVVQKTISLMGMRRIAGRWVPIAIDFRDEQTRNKTRLTMTAASFSAAAFGPFAPDHLAEPWAPPEQIIRWAP